MFGEDTRYVVVALTHWHGRPGGYSSPDFYFWVYVVRTSSLFFGYSVIYDGAVQVLWEGASSTVSGGTHADTHRRSPL